MQLKQLLDKEQLEEDGSKRTNGQEWEGMGSSFASGEEDAWKDVREDPKTWEENGQGCHPLPCLPMTGVRY